MTYYASEEEYNKVADGNSLAETIAKDFQNAVYMASAEMDDNYCQMCFERYIAYANSFLDATPIIYDGKEIPRGEIIKYLEKMEEPVDISNPSDFRADVTREYNKEMMKIGRANQEKAPEDQQSVAVKWTDVEAVKDMIQYSNSLFYIRLMPF